MSERSAGSVAVRVTCYAGYRGEESPRRFTLGERSIDVAEILERWREPEHRYFKVRGAEKGIYLLRQEITTGQWRLEGVEK